MSKPGRNDDCPCGSGKKFKHCHGQGAQAPLPPSFGPAVPNPIETNQLISLLNTRQYARAEVAAQSLIDRYPTLGFVWKMRGLAQLMRGKNPLDSFSQAAMLSPNDPEVHCNLANALQRHGRLQEAADSCQRALALAPSMVEALNTLANVLVDAGQIEDAIEIYGRALALKPNYIDALCNLSNALGRHGNFTAALEVARRALAITPTAEVHSNIGHALRALGDFEGALGSYQQALSLDPNHAVSLVSMGVLLRDLGRLEEAAGHHLRAVQVSPNYAEGYTQLGLVLQDMGRVPDAIETHRRSLSLRPSDAATRLALAMALRSLGRFDDAKQWAEQTQSLVPTYAQGHVVLGHLAADRGDFAAADASYRRALELDADSVEACIGLGRYGVSRYADAWLENAQRLLSKPQPLRSKVDLHYAIGECLDQAGDQAAAFEAFKAANEASKAYGFRHDPAASAANIDRIISLFDGNTVATPAGGTDESSVPVFVVGMPRSGTSLVEQILASHPAVHGAGEASFWVAAASQYKAALEKGEPTDDLVKKFAGDYVKALGELAPDASRVVDKLPANYLNLGLIHKALPNAKFIHVRRDPRDNCLSIYSHNFAITHPYSMDLQTLATEYQEYQRLMAHWRAVLPESALLEVRYEALVDDLEGESRRMLEFLGLAWDPACADFHRTERIVVTPSKRDVREPVYTRSIGRSERYAAFLGDLEGLSAS